jgi:hypothetical protein
MNRTHALRAFLMGVWTAATWRHFAGAGSAAPEQRHRAFADPPAPPQLSPLFKDRMFHVVRSVAVYLTAADDYERA